MIDGHAIRPTTRTTEGACQVTSGNRDQAKGRGEDLRCRSRFLAIEYHLRAGHWDATSRGRVPFRASGFQARAQVDGQWAETLGHPVEECRRVEFTDSLGEGTRKELSHRASEEPVVLTLAIALYRERPSTVLQVGVRNRTEAAPAGRNQAVHHGVRGAVFHRSVWAAGRCSFFVQ